MSRNCKKIVFMIFVASVVCAIGAYHILAFSQDFQSESSILKASEIIPNRWLKGLNYTVRERITNDGVVSTCELGTVYGPMTIESTVLLLKRMHELRVLYKTEQLQDSNVFSAIAIIDAALKLWKSGIHEARLLAGLVDNPQQVTEDQMEGWVKDFNSWDICDQVCSNLFDRTSFAYGKVLEWTSRDEEYVKRAGYALMAVLAVHDKKAGDEVFLAFLPIIKAGATDERNFVKKAVNWALRQIGKRNANLNKVAIKVAEEIHSIDSKSARWIASDALRELTCEAVVRKIMKQ